VSVATEDRYVSAAGRPALLRLYDPALALTTRERRFRGLLLERVVERLPHGGTVADVGCGTGTFAITLAAERPDATVVGIDGDPKALALARAKPGSQKVTWQEGLAGELALPDAGADAVVMSLLLHHLQPNAKHVALTDARRVLRAGGLLHVVDWGRPQDPLMRGAFLLLQTLDGFSNTRDHAAGRLPAIVARAGFTNVTTYARLRTAFGSLELLSAQCA
jgi:ubiquinone/menaquinone biosynthesis C-methylase UbiE